MKSKEEMLHAIRVIVDQESEDGFSGEFLAPSGWVGSLIVSWGLGWEHVSVCPYNRRIVPLWEDMRDLKEKFWTDEEWVVEYHPAKSEYVNNMPNCLHLWRPANETLPIPPSFMTGTKSGQTRADIAREIAEYEKQRRDRKNYDK